MKTTLLAISAILISTSAMAVELTSGELHKQMQEKLAELKDKNAVKEVFEVTPEEFEKELAKKPASIPSPMVIDPPKKPVVKAPVAKEVKKVAAPVKPKAPDVPKVKAPAAKQKVAELKKEIEAVREPAQAVVKEEVKTPPKPVVKKEVAKVGPEKSASAPKEIAPVASESDDANKTLRELIMERVRQRNAEQR